MLHHLKSDVFEGTAILNKSKVHPVTGHEGLEGELQYSSALSLTSALDGVGGQRHASAALHPGKILGTHCTEGCWPLGPVWTSAETLTPQPESDRRTVQPAASRYTD